MIRASSYVGRFLVPRAVVTLWYWVRFRAFVSPRAEVDLSPNLRLGRGTRVSSFVKIKAADGPLHVGARVDVGCGAVLTSGTGGLRIGDDCLVSPNVCVIAANYRYDVVDSPIRLQGLVSRGIVIGSNVWLGAGCCVLDGAAIASGVIVAPNSVVGAALPNNAVAHGSPARVIYTRH